MERDYRYTIGEKLKQEVIDLVISVYRANTRNSMDKLPLLQAGRESVEVVRLLLRVTSDLKQIKLQEFVSANEQLESISKQLSAWSNHVSKGETAKGKSTTCNGESPRGLFDSPESAG
jgi:hypothetical protein